MFQKFSETVNKSEKLSRCILTAPSIASKVYCKRSVLKNEHYAFGARDGKLVYE